MRRFITAILMVLMLVPQLTLRAEEDSSDKYLTVRGVVKDRESRRVLPYATVSLPGNEAGTVSNSEGEFIFKVRQSLLADASPFVMVSHLGYNSARLNLTPGIEDKNVVIWLTPRATLLSEIIVSGRDPRGIVEEAVSKIDRNYCSDHLMLTGFYRETARKRRHYINVAEAVIEVSKTPYHSADISRDRVRVLRGRKLLSQRAGDTLAVKLVGGPTLAVYLDIVKNTDELLCPEMMACFAYQLESVISLDDRRHYVVAFYPQVKLEWALYHGRFFIDMETLTLTRAEFMLDMSDREKATSAILRKKPAGLRFKPVEASYIVDYKPSSEGRSRLSYVRSEICFKCDWRRRLLSTEYGIVSEMVVTDSRVTDGQEISRHEQFSRSHVFSDEAALFYDPDFWGAYNIIAPEESLEHAVKKLMK